MYYNTRSLCITSTYQDKVTKADYSRIDTCQGSRWNSCWKSQWWRNASTIEYRRLQV